MSDKPFDIVYLEVWASLHEMINYMNDNHDCILFKEGFPACDRYLAYNNMLWLLGSVTNKMIKLKDEEAQKAGIEICGEENVYVRF